MDDDVDSTEKTEITAIKEVVEDGEEDGKMIMMIRHSSC